MNGWIVAALVLNAALVVVVIAFAVRVAGRSVVVAVELELRLHPPPVAAVDVDEAPRLPLFTHAEMMRTEWRAHLDAFDAARGVYLQELTAWRNGLPRTTGALTHAIHDLDIARWRLTRFERSVTAGAELDAPGRR